MADDTVAPALVAWLKDEKAVREFVEAEAHWWRFEGHRHISPRHCQFCATRSWVALLEDREAQLANALSVRGFDRNCADKLADEVAVLVRRRVIDSRSAAADALLDYRNPPVTPRSERLSELEAQLAASEAGHLEHQAFAEQLMATNERLGRELAALTTEFATYRARWNEEQLPWKAMHDAAVAQIADLKHSLAVEESKQAVQRGLHAIMVKWWCEKHGAEPLPNDHSCPDCDAERAEEYTRKLGACEAQLAEAHAHIAKLEDGVAVEGIGNAHLRATRSAVEHERDELESQLRASALVVEQVRALAKSWEKGNHRMTTKLEGIQQRDAKSWCACGCASGDHRKC